MQLHHPGTGGVGPMTIAMLLENTLERMPNMKKEDEDMEVPQYDLNDIIEK